MFCLKAAQQCIFEKPQCGTISRVSTQWPKFKIHARNAQCYICQMFKLDARSIPKSHRRKGAIVVIG